MNDRDKDFFWAGFITQAMLLLGIFVFVLCLLDDLEKLGMTGAGVEIRVTLGVASLATVAFMIYLRRRINRALNKKDGAG